MWAPSERHKRRHCLQEELALEGSGEDCEECKEREKKLIRRSGAFETVNMKDKNTAFKINLDIKISDYEENKI